MAGTVLVAFLTYLLMLVAYRLHRHGWFHRPVMLGVVVFDIAMPFYLYANKDWYKRLIESGDILSFMLWTHIGLLITLFMLYLFQVQAGLRLFRGDQNQREAHRMQGRGILLVRAFVILSGAMLVDPNGS